MIGTDDYLVWRQGYNIIGVDEAGRGPIAGPMFVAAVQFFPEDVNIIEKIGLNDSKKISEKKRFIIEEEILKISRSAVSIVNAVEINSGENLNILFKNAAYYLLRDWADDDTMVFVDGNIHISGIDNQILKPKFDSLSWSVAAASILAKNAQVRYMLEIDKLYPDYSFIKHKGYGTKVHFEALKKYGLIEEHRKSWIKKDKI